MDQGGWAGAGRSFAAVRDRPSLYNHFMPDTMSRSLPFDDPEVSAAIDAEVRRQHEGLEMIASENFVSRAVLEAAGTVFTNKYAEGYPGKRYYGGCEFADVVENLARDRAKEMFRRRACERAAALGLAGQRGGVYDADAAGGHDPGAGPGAWRAFDAWAQAEFFGQAVPRCVGTRCARTRRRSTTTSWRRRRCASSRR